MEKTLDKFGKGEKGKVKRLYAEGAVRRRLLDMGITPGAELILRKAAWRSDRDYSQRIRADA